MPVEFTCPSCGGHLQVADTAVGLPATCPQCQANFTVPRTSSATVGSPFQRETGDPDDPYAPPQPLTGGVSYTDPASGLVVVTEPMQRELAATHPWVLFMAVLLWIGCALIGIVSLFVFMAALAALVSNAMPGVEMLAAAIYPILAIVYGIFAWRLQQFAGNLRAFGQSNRGEDLLAALRAQKSFWRLAGIIVIAYLCLMIVVFVVAMIWAMMSM